MLEAVSAAPVVKKLALEIGERETDPSPGLNREILEEECLAMSEVQAANRRRAAAERRRDAKAFEIIPEPHNEADATRLVSRVSTRRSIGVRCITAREVRE